MGIKQEYERRRGEYIEYGRAVALLARNEQVSFSNAANWLVENGAAERIPCYIRAQPRSPQLVDSSSADFSDVPGLKEFVPHHPKTNASTPLSDGPMDILSAIVQGDNLWWEWIGVVQKSIDENQRWKRDEFWKFVVDHDVVLRESTFDDSSDRPTFMADLSGQRRPASGDSRPTYRGSAAAWRNQATTLAKNVSLPEIVGERNVHGTVLRRLEEKGVSKEYLQDHSTNGRTCLIARVILESANIADRAQSAWEYKSIADLSEELFVLGSSANWPDIEDLPVSGSDRSKRSWDYWAMSELIAKVNLRAWEEEEGLRFFVKSAEGSFRSAEETDGAYTFMRRLRAEGLLDDSGGATDLPSWSRELYVSHANWDSVQLVWASQIDKHSPKYRQFIEDKNRLVDLETARRLNRLNILSPDDAGNRAYLDANSPLYPQELAIAVAAWEAVTSQGKTAPDGVAAKAALMNWLNANYPALPEGAKDRISTVANWNKRGGATRTPE
ncbi:hypothetical protein [Paraburkholderia bannensis]|uniref:hypothetical protein n=1 Tax=Paraburkholderia bannensis TaxID=765414 RepID=UPI002AB6119B|nr:hypothetical protein [Paraburkholderia bannensis]